MNIETTADAFAVLAALVVGADAVGTFTERRYLFEEMRGMKVFSDLDRAAFTRLISDRTSEVCSTYPTADGRVSDEGVETLLGQIAARLDPELRLEAFRMAAGLARSDGMDPHEDKLLGRVRDGFGIDPEVARDMIEGAD
jgi:uncharacterized tellurite resistance protein B-like protein